MPSILVIDDDPDLVSLVCALFEASGYAAFSPPSIEGAVAAAEKHLPDLIVLDIRMAPLSGWEVLEKLRTNHVTARIPVLMVSASEEVSDRVRALRHGADDFVRKPFEPAELVARAERMIARHALEDVSLRGQLEAYPLPTLLQSLEQQSKSGVLRLHGNGDSAFLGLRGGRLEAAEWGDLQGLEALWAVLDKKTGTFSFGPEGAHSFSAGSELDRRSIQSVLLDVAWVEDELAKRVHLVPATDTALTLVDEAGEVDDDYVDLPIDPIVDYLRQRPGASLGEILDELPLAPHRVRFALAWLIEQGSVATSKDVDLDLGSAAITDLDLAALLPQLPPAAGGKLLVTVLLTAGALPALQRTLAASPWLAGQLGGVDAHATLTPLAGSSIRFSHQDVQVEIWLRLLDLDAVGEIFEHARRSAGVVLWLGDDLAQLVVPPRLIAASSRSARLLLVTPRPELGQKLLASLGAASRWQHLYGNPASMQAVLTALAGEGEMTSPQTATDHDTQ